MEFSKDEKTRRESTSFDVFRFISGLGCRFYGTCGFSARRLPRPRGGARFLSLICCLLENLKRYARPWVSLRRSITTLPSLFGSETVMEKQRANHAAFVFFHAFFLFYNHRANCIISHLINNINSNSDANLTLFLSSTST